MIKIAITLFLVVLGADLWTDYRLWQDGLPINHVRGAWLRTAALMPTVAILAGFWPRWGELGIPEKWLALLATTILMVGAVFWTVFDASFNLLRGFPPMFNGSVDPDDSKLDTFLMTIPALWEAVLKIGLVAGSIWLWITTRKKWV